jgi:hypothetical protein
MTCNGKAVQVACTACGGISDISFTLSNAGGGGYNAATDTMVVAMQYPSTVNKMMGPINVPSSVSGPWDVATLLLPSFPSSAKDGEFLPFISYGANDNILLALSANPFKIGTSSTVADPVDGKLFSTWYDGAQKMIVTFKTSLISIFLESKVGGTTPKTPYALYNGCSTVSGTKAPVTGGGKGGIGQLEWNTIPSPTGIYPPGNYYLGAQFAGSSSWDAKTMSKIVTPALPFSSAQISNSWAGGSGASSLGYPIDIYLSVDGTNAYMVAKSVTFDSSGSTTVSFSKSALSGDGDDTTTTLSWWAKAPTSTKVGIIGGSIAGLLLICAAIYFAFFHKKVMAAVAAS